METLSCFDNLFLSCSERIHCPCKTQHIYLSKCKDLNEMREIDSSLQSGHIFWKCVNKLTTKEAFLSIYNEYNINKDLVWFIIKCKRWPWHSSSISENNGRFIICVEVIDNYTETLLTEETLFICKTYINNGIIMELSVIYNLFSLIESFASVCDDNTKFHDSEAKAKIFTVTKNNVTSHIIRSIIHRLTKITNTTFYVFFDGQNIVLNTLLPPNPQIAIKIIIENNLVKTIAYHY